MPVAVSLCHVGARHTLMIRAAGEVRSCGGRHRGTASGRGRSSGVGQRDWVGLVHAELGRLLTCIRLSNEAEACFQRAKELYEKITDCAGSLERPGTDSDGILQGMLMPLATAYRI